MTQWQAVGVCLVALCATWTASHGRAQPPDRCAEDLAAGKDSFDRGELEGARLLLERVERCPANNEQRAEASLYLGYIHFAAQETDAAATAFQQAVRLDRDVEVDAERFAPEVVALFHQARKREQTEAAPQPPATTSAKTLGSPSTLNTDDAAKGSRSIPLGSWILGGVAIAATAAAIGLTVSASGTRSQACDLLPQNGVPCEQRTELADPTEIGPYRSLYDSAQAKYTASYVLWGIAAAGAIGSLTFYLFGRSSSPNEQRAGPRVSFTVGATSRVVSTWSF